MLQKIYIKINAVLLKNLKQIKATLISLFYNF